MRNNDHNLRVLVVILDIFLIITPPRMIYPKTDGMGLGWSGLTAVFMTHLVMFVLPLFGGLWNSVAENGNVPCMFM